MGAYPYIKALHLIAVVSWFAGLLYIVRLFIYHVESASRPATEREAFHAQFTLMERRLWYGITWPAMAATTVLGLWMMVLVEAWTLPWFHLKSAFLVLLIGYHLHCGKIRKDLAAGRCRRSSTWLRVWNEAATLLLFAIVFAAVLKSPSMAGKAMLGVAAFAALLLAVLTFVRRNGKRKA